MFGVIQRVTRMLWPGVSVSLLQHSSFRVSLCRCSARLISVSVGFLICSWLVALPAWAAACQGGLSRQPAVLRGCRTSWRRGSKSPGTPLPPFFHHFANKTSRRMCFYTLGPGRWIGMETGREMILDRRIWRAPAFFSHPDACVISRSWGLTSE